METRGRGMMAKAFHVQHNATGRSPAKIGGADERRRIRVCGSERQWMSWFHASFMVGCGLCFPAMYPTPCWSGLTWGVHPIARHKLLPHLNLALAVCGREAKRVATGRSAAIGVPI